MAESELARLGDVLHALRRGCPWDAEQTHRSLVRHLVEESAEVVEAIESGTDDDLREELGDLLLQVYFHAEIAGEEGRFTIEDVARGIADKLVARHPYVFADAPVPADVLASWEQRKKAEKGRTSALDGIPPTLPALARAGRVVARARAHGVPLDLPDEPLDAAGAGAALLGIVARATGSGVDAEQALRAAVRDVEDTVRATEEAGRAAGVAPHRP